MGAAMRLFIRERFRLFRLAFYWDLDGLERLSVFCAVFSEVIEEVRALTYYIEEMQYHEKGDGIL